MKIVATKTATTASLLISLLTVEEILSAWIRDSSTLNLSTSALFSASRSSRFRERVLMITWFVPTTLVGCTFLSPVTSSTTGVTSESMVLISISSLKVTLVEVPPENSRL